MKIISGVYRIIVDGKSYVGSSVDVYRRWKQHKRTLEAGTNDNSKMQKAYDLTHQIKFELLEELYDVDAETLVDRENYYIAKYKAEFNINKASINKNEKAIYQFNLQGELINRYSSIRIASIATGISTSNIMHAAQENEKLTRTAGGYFWRYTDNINFSRDERTTYVYVYNLKGDFLCSYESIQSCIESLFNNKRGFHHSRINRVLRGLACSYLGYRFSYEYRKQLDNTQLLKIKSWFPVVQIAPDKKTAIEVYERSSIAAKKLNISNSTLITTACADGTKCNGYYWTRLGTKWSEMLEYPEGIGTTK